MSAWIHWVIHFGEVNCLGHCGQVVRVLGTVVEGPGLVLRIFQKLSL